MKNSAANPSCDLKLKSSGKLMRLTDWHLDALRDLKVNYKINFELELIDGGSGDAAPKMFYFISVSKLNYRAAISIINNVDETIGDEIETYFSF